MQKQKIKSFSTKDIVEWKSLKRFYEYFDNFLDDLQVRDLHDPTPCNQRIHYVPNIEGFNVKKVGKLSEADIQAFKNVRQRKTCVKIVDAAAKIVDFKEQRQKYVESEQGKLEQKQKEIELQRELDRQEQKRKKQSEYTKTQRLKKEQWARDMAAIIEAREQFVKNQRAQQRKEAAQKLEQERLEKIRAKLQREREQQEIYRKRQELYENELEIQKKQYEKWLTSDEAEISRRYRALKIERCKREIEMQQVIKEKTNDLARQNMTIEEAFEWLMNTIGKE